MKTQLAHLRHYVFMVLFIAAASVFCTTVAHHVYTLDFEPLASLCLPVIAVFFTFTSLLYIRGNAFAARRSRVRTLFAAETSMRATMWYLTGMLAGASLYGLFQMAEFRFDPLQPTWSGLWLVVFTLPCLLMVMGLLNLTRAACVIAPQFLTVASPYEVRRRIEVRAVAAS